MHKQKIPWIMTVLFLLSFVLLGVDECEPSVECFTLEDIPNLPENLPEGYDFSNRRYCLYLPDSYQTSEEDLPLLVYFPGTFAEPKSSIENYLLQLANREGIIVVAPDGHLYNTEGREKNWPVDIYSYSGMRWITTAFDIRDDLDLNFDIPFIAHLLDTIKSNLRVDNDRVYMSGHSIGAFATFFFGKQFEDQVAGIAPLEGAIYFQERDCGDQCNIGAGFDYRNVFNFCTEESCQWNRESVYPSTHPCESYHRSYFESPWNLPRERISGTGFGTTVPFPVYIAQGIEDPIVFPFNACYAYDQLRAEGHTVELSMIDGLGHDVFSKKTEDGIPLVVSEMWDFFTTHPLH